MTDPHVPPEPMSDAELMSIVKSVDSSDFQRIEPPAQVWPGLLIAVRDEQLGPDGSDVALIEDPSGVSALTNLLRSNVLRVAAALVLLGGLGAFFVTQRGDDAEAVTVATAAMNDDGLPVATTSQAWASVVCEDEKCTVEVEFTTVPDPGAAALELWVIDAGVVNMHSLGLVTGTGSFALPAGVVPAEFPIVDISVEPRDGVEAHSGQSVLRGVFEASA